MYQLRVVLAVALALALSGIATAQDRGWATAIAWSPDGETIAVGSSTGVWFFDTDFNELGYIPTPEMNGFSPTTMDWNANGDLLAIAIARAPNGIDAPILVIDVNKMEVISQIKNGNLSTVLRWRPQDDLILAGIDLDIIIWDAITGNVEQVLGENVLSDRSLVNYATSVCWLDANTIAAIGSYDVFIIDLGTGTTLKRLELWDLENVDCYQDTKLVSRRGVFDLRSGERITSDAQSATFAAYQRDLVDVAWSPDGKRFVAHGNVSLCRFGVFDGQTTALLAELQGSFSRLHDLPGYQDSIAWQPTGDFIVAVGQFDIRLWDAKTYALLRRYDEFEVGYHQLIDPDENQSSEERRLDMYSNYIKCPG